MPQLPKLYKPIDIETGYVLNQKVSYFSVIVPEYGVNLLYNPEIYDLYSYSSSVPLTLNPDTNFGINSVDLTMQLGDNFTYTLNQDLDNTTYTFSFYIKGSGTFKLSFRNSANVQVGGYSIVETYEYRTRVSHTITGTALINGNFFIEPQVPRKTEYNFSGFQLENKSYATTFISGNQKGLITNENPLPYYWTGVPHRSPSVRLATTRSGGRIVNFADLGLEVLSYEGFGLPEFDNNGTQIAMRYGSLFNNTLIEDRDLTINGQFTLCDKETFFCNKGLLSSAFSPSKTLRQQPVKMQFQLMDCTTPLSECVEFLVHYKSGLDGNIESLYGEKVSIDFKMFDPFFYKCGSSGASVCFTNTITGTNIIGTENNGILGDLNGGTPLNELIRKMTIGSDNALYTIGDTPGIGAVVNRWDGTTWTVIGTSIDGLGNGNAIEAGFDNSIYVGGQFNGINAATNGYSGSIPSVMNLAKYSIETGVWTWIGNVHGSVQGLEQLQDGRIAIVGQFDSVTTTGAVTTLVNNVAFYNPVSNAFETLAGVGTGIGDPTTEVVYCVKQTPDGRIWYGGHFTFSYFGSVVLNVVYSFTTGSTQTIQPIQGLTRRLNRTTTIGFGADTVYDLEYDANGTIYAAGYFDATQKINNYEASNPVTLMASNIPWSVGKFVNGNWDSIGLFAMVSPANPILIGSALVSDIDRDSQGNLYFAGRFNFVGAAKYSNTQSLVPPGQATLNPMDNLANYARNTSGLTYYNGSKFLNNKILDAGSSPFVRTVKTGGYYSFNNYTSLYSSTLPVYNSTSTIGSPNAQNTVFIGGLIGTFTVACAEEVVLNCGDMTHMILTFTGPGTLLTIENISTGAILNVNKVLQNGELLTIDLTSPIPYVFSNIFGIQNNIIARGSNLANFVLLNGTNLISVLFDNATTTTNTKVRLNWRNRFWSLEEAICCED